MTAIENSPSVDALLLLRQLFIDGHFYRENEVIIRRILTLCSARATGINSIPPTAKTQ
ncbi:hypothetical protein [Corynebacterium parakroppenstedtii]|uniref:hypothetical protein n=1 Tax=Corynebacterium parakroppenstedtii TaxID=2828363 RepID=UPI00079C4AB0|nr:hypothetical protein HMPREF1861_00040 [Corynebacterium kroppenstedtii]